MARQKDEQVTSGFRDLLIFKFLMVTINHEFKATLNVPLIVKTEEEKQIFNEAEGIKKKIFVLIYKKTLKIFIKTILKKNIKQ